MDWQPIPLHPRNPHTRLFPSSSTPNGIAHRPNTSSTATSDCQTATAFPLEDPSTSPPLPYQRNPYPYHQLHCIPPYLQQRTRNSKIQLTPPNSLISLLLLPEQRIILPLQAAHLPAYLSSGDKDLTAVSAGTSAATQDVSTNGLEFRPMIQEEKRREKGSNNNSCHLRKRGHFLQKVPPTHTPRSIPYHTTQPTTILCTTSAQTNSHKPPPPRPSNKTHLHLQQNPLDLLLSPQPPPPPSLSHLPQLPLTPLTQTLPTTPSPKNAQAPG